MANKRQRPSGTWEYTVERKGGAAKAALPYRPPLVFLFELAIESAMRMQEMYTLAPSQIDVSTRTVFLDKTKNGNKRAVPMTSVALTAHQRYVDAVTDGDADMLGFSFDEGYLFPWIPEQQQAMHRAGVPASDMKAQAQLLAKVTSRLSGQFGRLFRSDLSRPSA
jgi:site-specific recombinase XerD